MAANNRTYTDIDEILDIVLDSDEEDIDLGDQDSNIDSDGDWEYEAEVPEPLIAFVPDVDDQEEVYTLVFFFNPRDVENDNFQNLKNMQMRIQHKFLRKIY